MINLKSIRLILFLVFMIVAPAGAQVLDQESPFGCLSTGTASFNGHDDILEWQQEVVVGITGTLAYFDMYVLTPGTCNIYINKGPPWQIDPHDFIETFTATAVGWNRVDTSGAGLYFSIGDRFVIGIQNTNGGLQLGGSYIVTGGCYPAGTLWLNSKVHSDGNWDLGFRTYVGEINPPTFTPAPTKTFSGPTPTPEPVPLGQYPGLGIILAVLGIIVLISAKKR